MNEDRFDFENLKVYQKVLGGFCPGKSLEYVDFA